jgi:hypothetical protein
MSVQHLSEIESSKRDPRLSSIERIADAMELAVMLVPEHMAPDIHRFIASQGRVFASASATNRACCARKSCWPSSPASWRFKTSSPIGCGALKCATNPLMCAKKLTGRLVLSSRPGSEARFHGGRGKKSTSHKHLIPAKDIWLYPLRKNFSTLLCK